MSCSQKITTHLSVINESSSLACYGGKHVSSSQTENTYHRQIPTYRISIV